MAAQNGSAPYVREQIHVHHAAPRVCRHDSTVWLEIDAGPGRIIIVYLSREALIALRNGLDELLPTVL